ncbi:MAG: ATP-binding cassette domain-containing protein, partial [Myxococcota bacterium]
MSRPEPGAPPPTCLLRARGLHKSLAGRRIIDDVSFDLSGGEIAVLSGDNGAGKTTLLRLVAGILHPDRGTIHLAGAELSRDPA